MRKKSNLQKKDEEDDEEQTIPPYKKRKRQSDEERNEENVKYARSDQEKKRLDIHTPTATEYESMKTKEKRKEKATPKKSNKQTMAA